MSDYISYILFRAFGFVIRKLPLVLNSFLGRRIGDLFYYFDLRHKALVYANIQTALGNRLSLEEISRATRMFYEHFGQSLIEVFLMPVVNERYLKKYISFEGQQFIQEALKKKKGVILLSMHVGSWELVNIACARQGFPFNFMVRQQPRLRRLEELLNSYRKSQGCKLIQRENQGRHLIEALKDNEVVGMTVDQGGASGMNASFFGKDASMATGAFRLALKYETVILPAYCARIKGPYLKIIIEQPFEVSKSSDIMQDIQGNLGRLMPIFQRYIEKYPYDYLWSYKIWKYSREKNILILSDGKAGHLRQSQAVAKVLGSCLEAQGKSYAVTTVDVKFKSNFSKSVLVLSSCLSGKYHCQGCLWCLRNFLEAQAYAQLRKARPDFIISCGSALSPINYILSRQYLAKSIVVMRPALLGVNRFNLVIMPWHDQPPKKKNVLVTDGALNIIDDEVLKAHAQRLIAIGGGALRPYPNIGFLIGGDSKKFRLKDKEILEAIAQLKTIATNINADILATTSRRTPAEIEEIVKRELGSCPRCKLLVIANEKNIPEAVAGILGLSQMVVSSCESISMISEAAASKRYVLVFGKDGLSKKHRRFLEHLEQRGHIYLTSADKLSSRMQQLWQDQPASKALMDNIRLEEALGKLL